MITSSKIKHLDGLEPEGGQSLRAWVRNVLSILQEQEAVQFMFCDVTVVRNYVSAFGASTSRKFSARQVEDGIIVTRIKK
jgi:hypothetical protein